jgi:hypothetical protein
MMRMFAAAAALLFIGVGALLADELKGKVKSVDTEKMQLVVTDDSGKEQTVTIGKEAKILGPNGKPQRMGLKSKQLKEGAPVTITYETKDGQMTASEVHITGAMHRKKGGD